MIEFTLCTNALWRNFMIYKTNWLAALLAPMLLASMSAHGIQAEMASSGDHSIFLDKGAVFVMGSNGYGQLIPGAGGELRTPVDDVNSCGAGAS